MASRFTDTGKWQDEWFVDLDKWSKYVFLYLCDNCDMAGFYELSTRRMMFDLCLDKDEIKGAMMGLKRCYVLSTDKRILFLKNFVKHQRNLPIRVKNKAHEGILRRFEYYRERFSEDLMQLAGIEIDNEILKSEIIGASKGHQRGTGNSNSNSNSKGNKGVIGGIDFQNFWDLYGKKVGDRRDIEKKWNALGRDVQQQILTILPDWKKCFATDYQLQPYPATFLNQQRWNDQIVIVSKDGQVGGGKYPKQYSRKFEETLNGKALNDYWAHLRAEGYKAKKDHVGNVIDWVQ